MRWSVVLAVALVSSRAGAEPISLASAIAEGARRGPAVVEAQKVRGATAELDRDHGSSLPSVPLATVSAGARDPRGLPLGPEVIVTVQQEVSFRGLGTARKQAAEWASKAARSEVERARLEGAGIAALQWVTLLETQELARVREAAAADAARLEKIADARATAGVLIGAERSLAKAEVGAARLARLDSEGRALEARLALAHATGKSLDTNLTAEGPLDTPIALGPARAPALEAAQARAHQANAEVAVAHAMSGPTFFFGGSAWREGSGDKAAIATVSVPLPFFDPARYDAAKQNVLAETAAARATRLGAELEHQLRLAQHECEHTREVKKTIDESVLLPLRAALTNAMTAYAAGTAELSVVLLARRSAFAAEEQSIHASAEVERADIKLATLNGSLVPR